MDFTKVRKITIPEGSVKKIIVDGQTIWKKYIEPPVGSIIGKWQFKDSLDLTLLETIANIEIPLDYSILSEPVVPRNYIQLTKGDGLETTISFGNMGVYDKSTGWRDNTYKKIEITDDTKLGKYEKTFKDWLIANATKVE